MASFPVDLQSTGSASYPAVASVHPALTTLTRINELAKNFFHPTNTASGFTLHHHIINTSLSDLLNALELAVSSMRAQSPAHVQDLQAQNPGPINNGTSTGTTAPTSVATTAVEGYQLPQPFAHETSHMGAWMNGHL